MQAQWEHCKSIIGEEFSESVCNYFMTQAYLETSLFLLTIAIVWAYIIGIG